MLLNRGWSFYDLGVGLRASGRLEQSVFREALDKIEKCGMDEEMRKRGVNSWIGTLMIQNDFRYKVFTGSEGMAVPFQGRILRKPAPGGFDHCCRQEIASLTSYRPIYQYILDRELVEVATLVRRFLEHGVRSVIQCRVDGIVACLPKKDRRRALEKLGEETWAAGKKLKVEEIGPAHRTLIPQHHVFSPTCEPGEAPKAAPTWQDVSKEQARAHMRAIKSALTAAKSTDSRSFRWFCEARRRGPVIGG